MGPNAYARISGEQDAGVAVDSGTYSTEENLTVKIRTRVLAGVAALATTAGLGLMAVPAHAASVTVNTANATVTCSTLSGTLKFVPALGGATASTTGTESTTIKAKLGGCFSSDTTPAMAGTAMFTGAISGTIVGTNGNECTGLAGLSTTTSGTTQVVWKAPKGYIFTPTQLVGTSQKPATNLHVAQTNGVTFTVPATDGGAQAQGPWAGTAYGEFQVGTAYGTTQMNTSGTNNSFTGGDTGHSGWFAGTIQSDATNLLLSCISPGLKSLAFGLGAVHGG